MESLTSHITIADTMTERQRREFLLGFPFLRNLCRLNYEVDENETLAVLDIFKSRFPSIMKSPRAPVLLKEAIQDRSLEFCKSLLNMDGGLDLLKIHDDCGRLPIHNAVRMGKLDIAEYLISLYPDGAYEMDQNGYHLIHYCCGPNDDGTKARFVISKNKTASRQLTNEGLTPLHLSCESRAYGMVRFFYDEWPDAANVHDRHGRAPVHLCISGNINDFFNLQAKIINNAGNDLRLGIQFGDTIQVAIAEKAALGTIKLLLDILPRWYSSSDSRTGETCLHAAARHDNAGQIFQWLYEYNDSLHYKRDIHGNTPMHIASTQPSNYNLLIYMVENCSWMIGEKNNAGRTPLQLLLMRSDIETTATLTNNDREEYYMNQCRITYHIIRADPVEALHALADI